MGEPAPSGTALPVGGTTSLKSTRDASTLTDFDDKGIVCPSCKFRIKPKNRGKLQPPWWTNAVEQAVQAKHRALQAYTRTGTFYDQTEYKQANAKARHIVREAKEKYQGKKKPVTVIRECSTADASKDSSDTDESSVKNAEKDVVPCETETVEKESTEENDELNRSRSGLGEKTEPADKSCEHMDEDDTANDTA